MTAEKVILDALRARELNRVDGSEMMGWGRQKLQQKLIRGTIYINELMKLMDMIDIDVILKDRSNEETEKCEQGTKVNVDALLRLKRIERKDAAAKIGWTSQKVYEKTKRDSLRADEFLEMAEALDVDVNLIDRKTGELLALSKYKQGYGEPVNGLSDGVHYDTEKADAVSNDFYADGEHEYGEDGRAQELYIDDDDRYFFAEYSINEGEKSRVRSAANGIVVAFIEKYGTDLHLDRKSASEDLSSANSGTD